MTIVRQATHLDEDAIYNILVDLHRHNAHGWGFPFRPEIVIGRIQAGTRPDPRARTNPTDQRRGMIGVIDGANHLIGTVGLFIENPMWFSDALGLSELWLYVRPEYRANKSNMRALFEFSVWAHEGMKAGLGSDYPLPFPLLTGFVNLGGRYLSMSRLWRRFSRGEECGALFFRE